MKAIYLVTVLSLVSFLNPGAGVAQQRDTEPSPSPPSVNLAAPSIQRPAIKSESFADRDAFLERRKAAPQWQRTEKVTPLPAQQVTSPSPPVQDRQ